jgi:hypothetical protein
MNTRSDNRVRSVQPHTRTTSSPCLARALLLAVLCSHIPTVIASPLPSLPASAPGFHSGAAPATHDTLSDAWTDRSDTDPAGPAIDVNSDSDDDWDLEYEEMANADENMGVDGMGNVIEKGLDTNPS